MCLLCLPNCPTCQKHPLFPGQVIFKSGGILVQGPCQHRCHSTEYLTAMEEETPEVKAIVFTED